MAISNAIASAEVRTALTLGARDLRRVPYLLPRPVFDAAVRTAKNNAANISANYPEGKSALLKIEQPADSSFTNTSVLEFFTKRDDIHEEHPIEHSFYVRKFLTKIPRSPWIN
eukprot:TRINITY_DN5362_c0_g1_i1.p1 TRINITY_DN5362_c0_g1~~TRINITY_DN5362_c0_g1_i1.p1  ORF type:complete len:113 (+),score=49.58 TRINITY_DN5362_c0_g1_i1:100-438(+)